VEATEVGSDAGLQTDVVAGGCVWVEEIQGLVAQELQTPERHRLEELDGPGDGWFPFGGGFGNHEGAGLGLEAGHDGDNGRLLTVVLDEDPRGAIRAGGSVGCAVCQ
jgi:hypothetical protein